MNKCMLLTVVLLLVLGGCGARRGELQPDARSQYDYALAKYQQEDFAEAVLEFQKVLFSYPGRSFIDSAQYWFAMSYYRQEDYHLGIAEFRRLINQFPESELIDDAQLMVGKSYFEAAPGNTGLDQSDTQQAIKELEAFLEDYPLSDRRDDGKRLLAEAREKIVKKRFDAAKQYYRMGNRISSRLYYEDIVTEHPDSRYAPESLYMLAKIDVKENKYIDARDKLNNLLKVFPESEIAEDAQELREEIREKVAEQEQQAGAETANQEE